MEREIGGRKKVGGKEKRKDKKRSTRKYVTGPSRRAWQYKEHHKSLVLMGKKKKKKTFFLGIYPTDNRARARPTMGNTGQKCVGVRARAAAYPALP